MSRANETYQGKTRKEWAAELGLNYDPFSRRVFLKGWEKAVAMGGKNLPGDSCRAKAKKYTVGGVEKICSEWAKTIGVPVRTLRERLTKYRTMHQALQSFGTKSGAVPPPDREASLGMRFGRVARVGLVRKAIICSASGKKASFARCSSCDDASCGVLA